MDVISGWWMGVGEAHKRVAGVVEGTGEVDVKGKVKLKIATPFVC
jgi:hypothetical protein